MTQKQVRMMVSLNKNTFCSVRRLAPFCIETNPRENRFFAASGRLVGKKALIMLKIRLKIIQNKSASSFLLARFWGANRLGQKRVLVEKWLMLCLSTEVKTPCVCKPLYEMGSADALNSLTEVPLRFMPNPRLQKEISQRHGEPCNWERCLGYPLQTPNFGRTGVSGAWMMAVSLACGQVAAFIRP